MTQIPDPLRQPQFYDSVPLKRLIAWVIDSIVILLIALAVVTMTFFVGFFIWPLLYLAVGFAYRVVTIANGSATLGMKFAGIELRDAYGARLDLTGAITHTAGYTISLTLPLLQLISIVMMLTSARGQGLTDAFLGTVMLNRRAVV